MNSIPAVRDNQGRAIGTPWSAVSLYKLDRILEVEIPWSDVRLVIAPGCRVARALRATDSKPGRIWCTCEAIDLLLSGVTPDDAQKVAEIELILDRIDSSVRKEAVVDEAIGCPEARVSGALDHLADVTDPEEASNIIEMAESIEENEWVRAVLYGAEAPRLRHLAKQVPMAHITFIEKPPAPPGSILDLYRVGDTETLPLLEAIEQVDLGYAEFVWRGPAAEAERLLKEGTLRDYNGLTRNVVTVTLSDADLASAEFWARRTLVEETRRRQEANRERPSRRK